MNFVFFSISLYLMDNNQIVEKSPRARARVLHSYVISFSLFKN